MALAGISLGNDVFGFGELGGALFSGNTVQGCGKRPLFPGKSRDQWDLCVQTNQSIETQAQMERASNIRTAIAIFGLVAFIVVISLVIRKK